MFPWVFNPPATYWDGLSEILKYVGGGSIDALKDKTIGYLYFDAGFGREPMPLFQSLAKEVGFDLKLYPVAPADMQNQSSKWLDIRRDKPDFLVMYGWGAMNPTAIKEAVKAGFPMDKFVSIWWPNDADAASAGDGAKGFKELNWHGTGDGLSGLGRHQGEGDRRRQEPGAEGGVRSGALQSRRLQLDADRRSDRQAQKITGKKVVTGEDVRRGLENINLDAARFKAIGLAGFAAPFKTTCADHNSHSATFVQQWDGAKWMKVSDLVTPDTTKVQPLLDEAAKAYAEKNAGWPARTRGLRQQVSGRALIRPTSSATFVRATGRRVCAPSPASGRGPG